MQGVDPVRVVFRLRPELAARIEGAVAARYAATEAWRGAPRLPEAPGGNLPPLERDALAALSREGLSMPEAAERLGVAICTVSKQARRWGLTFARQRGDIAGRFDAARAIADRDAGLGQAEAAAVQGISYSSFCRCCRKAGIAWRRPRGRR